MVVPLVVLATVAAGCGFSTQPPPPPYSPSAADRSAFALAIESAVGIGPSDFSSEAERSRFEDSAQIAGDNACRGRAAGKDEAWYVQKFRSDPSVKVTDPDGNPAPAAVVDLLAHTAWTESARTLCPSAN